MVFLYTIVYVPFSLAFMSGDSLGQMIVDQIVNTIFIVDIIMTLLTVQQINGREEDNPREIIQNYASSWLVVDILTMIPYDLLLNSNGYTLLAKMPRAIKFLKMT